MNTTVPLFNKWCSNTSMIQMPIRRLKNKTPLLEYLLWMLIFWLFYYYWWTSCSHSFYLQITITTLQPAKNTLNFSSKCLHVYFQNKHRDPIFCYQFLISMISCHFLPIVQKNMWRGLRVTLIFRKFMVALNSPHNFSKFCWKLHLIMLITNQGGEHDAWFWDIRA